MEQLIAMNQNRGGNKGFIETKKITDYNRLIDSAWLHNIVADIRRGSEGKKKELPFRAAHYARFDGCHRNQQSAVAESFLFQTTIDVDDRSLVETAIAKARELDRQPGTWKNMLLHLEYSARKKLHIDIRMPLGMTIEETQKAYCEALGIAYDASCITPERIIFITDRGSEIYRSADWYGILPESELKQRREAFLKRGLTIDGRSTGNTAPSTQTTTKVVAAVTPIVTAAPDERKLAMFDACIKKAGLNKQDLCNVGTRHQSLLSVLSAGACKLMSTDDLMACVAVRTPDFAREPDCAQLIRDFYDKYQSDARPMSRELQMIYSEALHGNESKAEDVEAKPFCELTEQQKKVLSELPDGLSHSLVGVPDNMKIQVLAGVMPLACAYADQATVTYCDGRDMNLGLMSMIIGEQASGKSTIKHVIDTWMQPLKEEDIAQRKREEEWKEEKKGRKANEKAPEDPHVLIRVVPITISNSTLLKRLKNSRGHTLYSFEEELDTLVGSNRAGAWSQKYDKYRLSFDRGEWGQDFNSDQAESGREPVAYNWTMLGTYGALYKCFKGDNVENGLSSRVIIAEMPDSTFAPMPHNSQPTAIDNSKIIEAVGKLRSAIGNIDTPMLREAIEKWVEERRLEALAHMDKVLDTYRRRAAVIGFRCGVVAAILAGGENRQVADFAVLMAEYTLREQVKIFGDIMEREQTIKAEKAVRISKNRSVFEQLSNVFTKDDVYAIRGYETSDNVIRQTIHYWKRQGWIECDGIKRWKKTDVC